MRCQSSCVICSSAAGSPKIKYMYCAMRTPLVERVYTNPTNESGPNRQIHRIDRSTESTDPQNRQVFFDSRLRVIDRLCQMGQRWGSSEGIDGIDGLGRTPCLNFDLLVSVWSSQ